MEDNYISSEEEVLTHLNKLKYALKQSSLRVSVQVERKVDENRPIQYTNKYTLATLFPNESPVDALKRELKKLKLENYMWTVKDNKFKDRTDMFVYALKYTDYVYIKIRVELISKQYFSNYIFVMSFHFSNRRITKGDFPYKKYSY